MEHEEFSGVEEQLLGVETDSEIGAIEEELGAPKMLPAQKKVAKTFARNKVRQALKLAKKANTKRAVKYQTETITIVAGTAAGTVTTPRINFDANYDECTGMAITDISGTVPFRVGLKDDIRQYQSPVLSEFNKFGSSAPMNERFTNIGPIKVTNNKVELSVQNIPLLGADLVFEVTFKLEK
ncbi:MAG: hypothetical protein AB7G44_07075 [Bacteroidia bacterium]